MRVNPQNALYERCESPAEHKLLHLLSKVYPYKSIRNQVPVLRYRMDFVTDDNIAWEVDGKQWHDEELDEVRDCCILQNSDIHTIVRIPAGAIHWYFNACVSVMRYWRDGCRGGYDVDPASEASECVDYWHALRQNWEDEYASFEHRCSDVARLHERDGYLVSEFVAKVGGALSFFSGWEDYVLPEEVALKRHQYRLIRKVK